MTSQQWQNTIAEEHQVHILFDPHIWQIGTKVRSDLSWLDWWSKERPGSQCDHASISFWTKNDILGEARTKAFKKSTIRPGVSGTPLKEPH